MDAETWVVERLRGPWSVGSGLRVLCGVVCLPGSHSVPMATSPFSVPYLTVSAESKLFTLFLSRGALCPIWTAHFGDISLCPTSCGEGQNQAAGASCWSTPIARGAPYAPPILLARFQEPGVRNSSWKHLSKGLDLTLLCKRRSWQAWVVQP